MVKTKHFISSADKSPGENLTQSRRMSLCHCEPFAWRKRSYQAKINLTQSRRMSLCHCEPFAWRKRYYQAEINLTQSRRMSLCHCEPFAWRKRYYQAEINTGSTIRNPSITSRDYTPGASHPVSDLDNRNTLTSMAYLLS